MNEHVVIIGGGIIGLLSGRELLARGRAVTILDRGDLRNSASTGNAGVISPGHAPIPTPEVAAKAIRMMIDPRSPLYIPPRPSLSLLRWRAITYHPAGRAQQRMCTRAHGASGVCVCYGLCGRTPAF